MNEMKHTPGPWLTDNAVVGWHGGECPAVRVSYESSPGYFSALAMCDTRGGEENAIANARLIAAAPDLLESLCDVLPVFYNDGTRIYAKVYADKISKAEAAIAKATGEE